MPATTPRSNQWQTMAKGVLKAELARRDITYFDLAQKLRSVGISENDRNIANKLARGRFSAVFLLQCLHAIGCKTIHLDSLGDAK